MAKNDSSEVADSLTPWNHPKVIANHRRRRLVERVVVVIAAACLAAVLVPLGDLLLTFILKGIELISWVRLTHNYGEIEPGLANAIIGTGVLTTLSSAIAIPLGVFGGIYMAEFASVKQFAEGLRFTADVLAGVPSIIVGYVAYLVLVRYFGFGFSSIAAAVALSVIMFPYIFRTTEIAIRRVPENLKEGSIALGSTKATMINRIALPFAVPSILTGIVLAIGISLSETAPLLYTAGWGDTTPHLPQGLVHNQIAYLTGAIWQGLIVSPLPSTADLGYLAAFILIVIVLALNVVARVGLSRFSKV